MTDVYVYNLNLQLIGIIDSYRSLIWADRYNEVGDCELYVPATNEMLNLLKKDYFLIKNGHKMVCQIKKIELDTDAENGDFLIVTGYDVKRWLDQRIVWGTATANGNAEIFLRGLVNDALCDGADADRQARSPNGAQLLSLGDEVGFQESLTAQISYANLGEKIRDFCVALGWGYRFLNVSDGFKFDLYRGTDRRSTVVFSEEYDNLIKSSFVEDSTGLKNVALVAGEGEGALRSTESAGTATHLNRVELYVDARDISHRITFSELTTTYPDPNGYIFGDSTTGYFYGVHDLNVQIYDDAQLAKLQEDYPGGQVVTVEGQRYYNLTDTAVAALNNESPSDNDPVQLLNIIYDVYLINRAYQKLAEFSNKTRFDGTVEPNTTFIYNKDYFLGDIVTVKNGYGVSAAARIVEVIEVDDENGSTVEPRFEFSN